jgi:hypothetical protein
MPILLVGAAVIAGFLTSEGVFSFAIQAYFDIFTMEDGLKIFNKVECVHHCGAIKFVRAITVKVFYFGQYKVRVMYIM